MTSKWTDDLLDNMRLQGDPLADEAARVLFKDEHSKGIFRQLHQLARNNDFIPESFPVELQSYFKITASTEFTAKDIEQFETTAGIFNRHGVKVIMLLFFKSLPSGYMCPLPAHVLGTTKLLESDPARRVLETAMMIFEVNRSGWYLPSGKGIRILQKVRLMHAGMRTMIKKDIDNPWDLIKMGEPINQEDMVYTIQLFSLAVIEGLHQMGVRLTTNEKEAFFATWKKIGRLLGISEELEPANIADGWALQHKIMKRQMLLPNQDGPLLAKALLGIVSTHSHGILSQKALEDITMFFLHEPTAHSSLGFHQPSTFDHLLDVTVKKLVDWDVWHYFYKARKVDAKPNFIQGWLHQLVARRMSVDHNLGLNVKTDFLEDISKILLQSLQKRAILSSGGHFFIDDKLIEEWELGSFDFDEAGFLNQKRPVPQA